MEGIAHCRARRPEVGSRKAMANGPEDLIPEEVYHASSTRGVTRIEPSANTRAAPGVCGPRLLPRSHHGQPYGRRFRVWHRLDRRPDLRLRAF